MPQLDPSSYPSQLFWLAITFASLLVGLKFWIVPAFQRIMKERWENIEGTLERAEILKSEAEVLKAEAEATLAEAHKKSVVMIRKAQEEIAADITRQQQQFSTEMMDRLKEADDKINFAKQKALLEAEKVVAETAQAIITKLIATPIDAHAIKSAVYTEMKKVA